MPGWLAGSGRRRQRCWRGDDAVCAASGRAAGLHLSSHNWERADEFLPERWEEPGAEYWPGDMCPARAGTRPEGSSGSTGASTRPLGGDEEEEEGDGAGAASASGAWTLVDSDRPPLRFAPFSQGPRICIGQVGLRQGCVCGAVCSTACGGVGHGRQRCAGGAVTSDVPALPCSTWPR